MSSFCKCKSYSHFFSKNISTYAIFNDQNFNDTLTNDIVSFEQLGRDSFLFAPNRTFSWSSKNKIFTCILVLLLSTAMQDLKKKKKKKKKKKQQKKKKQKKKHEHLVNVLKFGTFYSIFFCLNFAFYAVVSLNTRWNGQHCRP